MRLIEQTNVDVGDDCFECGVGEIARSDPLGELAGLDLGGGGDADAEADRQREPEAAKARSSAMHVAP